MAGSESCLFCNIAQGQLATALLYQDSQVVAFADINPQAPVHILVIPREHLPSIAAAGQDKEALAGHLLVVAAGIARDQGVSETGFRLVVNTGAHAGQAVHHIHIHVLGGRPMGWPPG